MDVGPLTARVCKFDGNEYLRFGPYDWFRRHGDSWEAVYNDHDVERLRQAFNFATMPFPG